jgi:DNA polymerase I-like protein with 3'-5' exonuclease and polymerase domains
LGIVREFKKRGLKARICATVHDSLEAVCPIEELVEVEGIMRDFMVRNPIMREVFGLEFSVPFEVDTICGHSFGDGIELEVEDKLVTNMQDVMEYLNVTQ